MSGWERVAARVDSERVRQGHRSLAAFARAAGLGKSTVDNLVHARKTSYDPMTLGAVEAVLGWQPGSVERVRRGLEPRYDTDPELAAVIDAWPKIPAGTRRMIRLLAQEAARPAPPAE